MQSRRQPRRRRRAASAELVDVRITEVRGHSLRGELVDCGRGAEASIGAAPSAVQRPPPRNPAHHRPTAQATTIADVGRHPAVLRRRRRARRPRQRRRSARPRPRGASRATGPSSRAPDRLRQRRRDRRPETRRREEVGEMPEGGSGSRRVLREPCRDRAGACALDARQFGPSSGERQFYNLPMSVFALGLNHTTAPLDLRGRFAFAPQQLATTLKAFRARLEAGRGGRDRLDLQPHRGLRRRGPVQRGRAGGRLARRHRRRRRRRRCARTPTCSKGRSAARHAFRVASGLDSMVLGEPQILGQLKEAVREADSAGTLGSTLQQMFQRSFAVAKEVRIVDRDRHRTRSAWPRPRCASPRSCSRTCARPRCCSSAPATWWSWRRRTSRRATRSRSRSPTATLERGEKLGGALSAPRRCAWPTCRRVWPSSTSSCRRRRARCRSSAWAPSSARSSCAGTGRCSWSISRCRATSSRKSRAFPTSISIRSTTFRRWCRSPARSARPRWRRPRRSSRSACRASSTGSTSAARCR